ncbi:fibronectin type III-like domain-contianing protein, partial [Lachnospiraceae bacterium OttesenSCG-928-D06]|nr:fibronectin type III-like domain-contianing protein [Lachnospiraceae bacterium OttesenSCG-928-D06]
VEVTVKVTNTGTSCAGKEVVQVYYSAPAGRLEKPYQELAAYAKTGELAPGESETLTVSYPTASMASYDTEKAAFVMEEGIYYVRVGNHSRNTHVAAALCLDGEAVTEILSNRLTPDCEMAELSAESAVPYAYETERAEKEAAPQIFIHAAEFQTKTAEYRKENAEAVPLNEHEVGALDGMDEVWKLTDVIAGKITLDELVGQLTVEEMAALCVGASRGGFGNATVIGAASVSCPGAAGDTTSELLEKRGITNIVLADGPAGLRLVKSFMADQEHNPIPGMAEMPMPEMEKLMAGSPKPPVPEGAVTYYQYCTAIPIATLLAQTWDVGLIEEAGDIVGEEMEEFGVTLWLAPGMNIQRNPLCGRNFEYYSEDPLVAGMCAAADTKGVQKHQGAGTTIKHFACNNQEDNRMHTNAHVSERALREIYLKGFEIAVKTAQPLSIMTSYNLLNGIHTANNYDLITAIARDEWGFEGVVMTDWGTTGSIDMEPGKKFKYGHSNAAGCIWAGNDLNMPGSKEDVEEILRSVEAKEGEVSYKLTKADLQACAKRILSVVMKSAVYR